MLAIQFGNNLLIALYNLKDNNIINEFMNLWALESFLLTQSFFTFR